MLPTQQRIVVLGAGYAGVLAALRLTGKAGKRAQVTLVDPRGALVQRIRLHELAAGREVATVPLEWLTRGRPLTLVRDRAVALDLERGRVELGGAQALPFDWLVNAVGSTVSTGLPGIAEHGHALADPAAALRLRTALEQAPDGAVVTVCGGGLTGIELATEIASPHRRVRLLTSGRVGPGLDEAGRAHVVAVLARLGVELVEHAAVAAFEPGRIVLADGRALASDVHAWCGGFAATSPLAREAGLAVGEDGRMRVDATLRSLSHANVLGAGDAALAPPLNGGVQLRMACATALPMGAHAADTVVAALRSREAEPLRYGYLLQCISLGRRDGLIQLVDALDAPRPRVFTGGKAARLKELICRSTVWTLRAERRLPGTARYPGGLDEPIGATAAETGSTGDQAAAASEGAA
jgi:NADH dehydrogenase FAD-containing subunit